MVVNPLKIFLFLLGGSAAAGATAYVSGALDPYLSPPAAVLNLPGPAPSDPAAPKDERLPGAGEETPPNTMAALPPPEEAAPPATMAPQPPADAAATPPAGPQPPTFDIVRVEPDGSVVVAGKAMPDALVELLNGEAVLGSDKSTPEGDFAIVLDEKLKPGDYQLALRATPASGAAVASLETAVLSIPEKPDGQVLAMVEQPGQPSEILTVPQPEAPAEAMTEEAVPPADAPKTEAPAQEQKPADVATIPAETPPPADAPKTEGAATPPADEQKPPKTEEAAAPPAAEKPAEVAAAPAETAPPPAAAKVAVEAVEIDGGKIFVAGVGEPGRFVRVYANEMVLGETKVSAGGRFLVEAKRDLPVGEYIIRADLLDADGVKVIARAAVPFEREPGESIAAVAPGAEQPADAGKPAGAAAGTDQATPPADNQAPPADVAAEPAAPQPEQPAVAAETPPAAQPEQPAVAATEPPPADGSAAGTNPPASAAAETPPATAPAEAATQPPASLDGATQPPASGTEIAAQPPETVSPKLQNVQGAVIIRRGDTLWRISRRVYGKGIRYSTIYLANQKQISDPDRIWPGQVFSVPEKSQEGEPADMSAMGSQMTTTPPAE